MSTSKNLRYCEVLHDGDYYDVMIAVNTLDEVNDILQEWALANPDIGEALDLPKSLVQNTDAKEINISTKQIDSYVYEKTAATGYMDAPRYVGISGDFPTLPKTLTGGEYVMPITSAFLWTENNFSGIFANYNISSKGLALTDNQVNYIGIDYNSGSPEYMSYGNQTSFNYSSNFPVCSVLVKGGELNVIPFGQTGFALPEKQLINQYYRKEFKVIGSYDFSVSGLYIILGNVAINSGVSNVECLAMNTSIVNNDWFEYSRDTLGDWSSSSRTQINNTQYQSESSGLQTLNPGEYVVNYIYRVIDDTNLLLFSVLSNKFSSLQDAKESDNIYNLPDAVKEGSVLVGRVIVQAGSSSPLVQKVKPVSWGTV